MKSHCHWLVTAALLFWVAPGWALESNTDCPTNLGLNGFGRPLDYNSPSAEDQNHITNNVERNHFTKEVEALLRGKNGTIPGDISFTLRAIPNHYRALNVMSRWQLKNGPFTLRDDYWRASCYFDRALLLTPNDPIIHMLYGVFLHKSHQLSEVLVAYRRAEELDPTSMELQYNLGLLFLEQGDNDQALVYAKKAYEQNYPLPGLRNMLMRKGVWKATATTSAPK